MKKNRKIGNNILINAVLFYRYAGGKLEPKTDPMYEREFGKEGEDFSDISKVPIGSRTRYYPMLDLIEKDIEKNGGDYRKVVAEHFPKVSDGLACSLLHGLIQLGKNK